MSIGSPLASIVVSTFQRRGSLSVTLDRLQAQDVGGPYEIVVVDNGSTDGTADDLAARAERDERLRVIRIDVNNGPGPARNAGWRAATSPFVAFTDDDTEPRGDWLRRMLEPFASGADVVMGQTMPPVGAFEAAGPFSHWLRVERSMPWFPTCNIAYRRDLLESLDGFDDSFTARVGASFGDDTDLGWRALRAGADVRFNPAAIVEHEVTTSDFRAHVRAARRRAGVPAVIASNPGLRAQLPLPYVYTRAHHRAAVAVLGLLAVGLRPRSHWSYAAAAVLLRPYVAFRTTGSGVRPGRRSRSPWVVAGLLFADLAEMAVVARHALRVRTPLL